MEQIIISNNVKVEPATKEGLCKRLKNKGHSCPLCEKETVEIEDITSTATDEDSFKKLKERTSLKEEIIQVVPPLKMHLPFQKKTPEG